MYCYILLAVYCWTGHFQKNLCKHRLFPAKNDIEKIFLSADPWVIDPHKMKPFSSFYVCLIALWNSGRKINRGFEIPSNNNNKVENGKETLWVFLLFAVETVTWKGFTFPLFLHSSREQTLPEGIASFPSSAEAQYFTILQTGNIMFPIYKFYT